MGKYFLKLFITGRATPQSERAIANLHYICQQLNTEYEMTVIDVLEQPQLAEEEHVIATPTLVKILPPPPRKIIGDLSNQEKVLSGLGLPPFEHL